MVIEPRFQQSKREQKGESKEQIEEEVINTEKRIAIGSEPIENNRLIKHSGSLLQQKQESTVKLTKKQFELFKKFDQKFLKFLFVCYN